MGRYSLTLKWLAPVFIVAGLLHVVLGLRADQLLGAVISAQSIADPVLDSQNRFYGAAFMLYGVLLYLAATDLLRYQTLLRCLLGVFFIGGLARLVSIALVGVPGAWVIALMGSELLLPPLLWLWLNKLNISSSSG